MCFNFHHLPPDTAISDLPTLRFALPALNNFTAACSDSNFAVLQTTRFFFLP